MQGYKYRFSEGHLNDKEAGTTWKLKRKLFINCEEEMNKERSYYLDYLRIISILLLFPVHTFMIWNDYGQKFYVWSGENKLLSSLIILINPWFMPLLFAIAGMCARYSLEKRTEKEFILERVIKLFVPFLSGIILLVPFQTLFARKYFYNYSGTLQENILYFFSHFTDLSGYDGCFTPGQLWFLLFLFIISLVSLLLFKMVPYDKIARWAVKMNIYIIVGLFICVWMAYYIGNFGGFSLGKNMVLYLLGYYILSNETILDELEKYRNILFGLFCFCLIMLFVFYYYFSYYGDIAVNFIGWLGICSLIPFAKKHFNKRTKLLVYFKKASFPLYILHQSILVAVGYYVLLYVDGILIQAVSILAVSFLLTLGIYELIKRIPYVRVLFGIK